jgi:hypothetical protein
MKQVILEEAGWLLDYNEGAIVPGKIQTFSLMDGVPGGTRGILSFNESDIRAFKVLFKKFALLKEQDSIRIKDEDLFDDDETIQNQINKKGKTSI